MYAAFRRYEGITDDAKRDASSVKASCLSLKK